MRRLLVVLLFAACSSEDERQPIGTGNPLDDYCTVLGYTDANDRCTFPDGTSCPLLQFFTGSCGQPFSYCEKHGGTISTLTTSDDAMTAVSAQCTKDGVTCAELDFVSTHECK